MNTSQLPGNRPTIFDLNVSVSDYCRSILRNDHPGHNTPEKPTGMRLRHFSERILKERPFSGLQHSKDMSADILIFASTNNQKKTLQFLLDCEQLNTAFVTLWPELLGKNKSFLLRQERILIQGGLNLWRIAIDTLKCKNNFQRKSVLKALDQYVLALGSYLEWQSILQTINPHSVVVANDYNPTSRPLLYAAHQLGVKSYYIPHALIGIRYFSPPVPVADVVCYGNDIERKRLEQRRLPQIYPQPKLKYLPRYVMKTKASVQVQKASPKSIGVSINSLDDRKVVMSTLAQLREWLPNLDRIYLRPHPNMNAGFDSLMKKFNDKIIIHHGDLDNFFSNLDLHIAGSTLMHLESIIRCIPSLMFPAAQKHDHYGFLETKLVTIVNKEIIQKDLRKLADQQVNVAKREFLTSQRQKEHHRRLLINELALQVKT